VYRDNRPPRLRSVKPPSKRELEDLAQQISHRVASGDLGVPESNPRQHSRVWEADYTSAGVNYTAEVCGDFD